MLKVEIIKETDHPKSYQTAKYLEKLFIDCKTIIDGTILIVCDLTCYGFKEKDIDLFVVGDIKEGYLKNELYVKQSSTNKSTVFIHNFCFHIKEIFANSNNVHVDEGEIYVTNENKKFNISSYSNTQNSIVRNFIKGTTGIDVFVFNMLLFSNLGPKYVDKNIYNTLRSSFTIDHIFQNLLFSGVTCYEKKDKSCFNVYSSKKIEIDLIKEAINTFSHLKKSIGKLTKRKLDFFSQQFLKDQNYVDYIGKMPLIIRGPAGSGKTMKLIGIAKDLYLKNKRCLFLTYNQSLVKDLTRLITLAQINSGIPDAAIRAYSIHSYLLDISGKLKISESLLEVREKEIKKKYDDYKKKSSLFFKEIVEYRKITNNFEIENEINSSGKSEFEIDQLNSFLGSCVCTEKVFGEFDIDLAVTDYFNGIMNMLLEGLKENFFINNYFLYRKQILNFLNNDYSLVAENEILDKVLTAEFKFTNLLPVNYEDKFSFFKFIISKIKHQLKIWDYIFIDEAQDWHQDEKEIIYLLFGTSNIIISDGLKQQLVRSKDYLDWGFFNSKEINVHSISLSKSLRQKENLSKFQNEFALSTNVSWNVNSAEGIGKGRIIISTIGYTKEINDSLNQVGIENKCDNHDSLLFLIPPSLAKRNTKQNVYIDEKDRIKSNKKIIDKEFVYKNKWANDWKMNFWDGIMVDKDYVTKKSLPMPLNEQHRVIHYESSRGLEAWSVVCLDMDDFFESKMNHLEIEDDKQLLFDVENQSIMYAANWCLIAMSRAVDTLVIVIKNKESKFASILRKLANEENKYIKWIE